MGPGGGDSRRRERWQSLDVGNGGGVQAEAQGRDNDGIRGWRGYLGGSELA